MITLKTSEEIAKLYAANQLVARTLGEVAKYVQPGVTTKCLDTIGHDFIMDNGAYPAFLGYDGFPGSLCISVNEQVVHGIPSDKVVLQEGDIVSIDCGTKLDGFIGDSAFTFPVGEVAPRVRELLATTHDSLYEGIAAVQSGRHIGDIGHAIQTYCEKRGFSVVREFVGHGIGTSMHEAPNVPNYGRKGTGALIQDGLCICIEPMINMGSKNITSEADSWTIRTRDRKPSAHFELCVAVVNGKAELMSSFEFVYAVIGSRKF